MNKEDTQNLEVSKKKALYKEELEKRRQRIDWNSEICQVFGKNSLQDGCNNQTKTFLDVWFIVACDANPVVKKYLNFYYDCIKEGRYDEILKRILKSREVYEHVCSEYFRNKELTNGRRDFSELYTNLLKFKSTPISDIYIKDKGEIWEQEFQNSIATILFKAWFHVNIFALGLTMSKSHPFIGESWLSNEFGVLGGDGKTPSLVQGFEGLRSVWGHIPHETNNALDSEWELKLEEADFESLGEVNDSMKLEEYSNYLIKMTDVISSALSKRYDLILESFLFSFRGMKSENPQRGFDFLKNLSSATYENNNEQQPPLKTNKPLLRAMPSIEQTNENETNSPSKCVHEHPETIFPVPLISDEYLIAFVNPGDYENAFSLVEKTHQFSSLYEKIREFASKGWRIHKHRMILPGHMAATQIASFVLINLSSNFLVSDLNYYLTKKDVYLNFTFCTLAFAIGGYLKPDYSIPL